MYQQTSLFFYRFRYLLASILTVAFLLSVSALVTAIGSGTVLEHPSASHDLGASASDSPNVVTVEMSALANGTQRVTLLAGSALYDSCRSVTAATVQSGKTAVHGSTAVVGGIGKGIALTARGIGSGILFTLRTMSSAVMFTVRMPGKVARPITRGQTVNSIIKPADDKPVPVISAETSAAALASFNAAQRQQIEQWQAAQLTANRQLNGSIVAGDTNHGGYPARWDTIRQDSTLDTWGMYNRECVSYAAWKVYQTYGSMPYWGGVGNANEWPSDARRAGIPTSRAPRVHSVAISMRGYYGHAMWVEKVSGSMIYVSQYNYDLHGHYSEMWVNGSNFTYLYFK